MFIIVEGSDGSGKTTLIETIRQKINRYFWIMRPSHPPTDADQIHNFLADLEQIDTGLLLDRHPLISEPIYGPILRGIDLLRLIEDPIDWCDWVLQHLNRVSSRSMIIYCRPPIATIIENVTLSAPQQLEGVVPKINEIVSQYDIFFENLRETRRDQPVSITYDYTREGDLDRLFSRLNFWLGVNHE